MFNDGQVISENVITIRISVGKLLTQSFKQYNVKNLIVHEQYDSKTFEHDIALIKLKETLDLSQNFRAICFSQLAELPHASVGIAVGYGSTDKSRETLHSDVLKQVEIPIVDSEDCLDSDYEFFSQHLFPGNFCAGEIYVMKGVCSGDSGSVFRHKTKRNNSFPFLRLKVADSTFASITIGICRASHPTQNYRIITSIQHAITHPSPSSQMFHFIQVKISHFSLTSHVTQLSVSGWINNNIMHV